MLPLPWGILYMSIAYIIGIRCYFLWNLFSCGLLNIISSDIVGNVWHNQVGPWPLIEAFGAMFFPFTYSSICPTWNAYSEGKGSTLGSGWLGYSPRNREEWHHHILYCPAARHTWCCCPEWDSCSGGPNLWLTSVTCSQPHQFGAIHQICVESCSHNHCWNWSFFINWHYGSIPYIRMEWVVMRFLISVSFAYIYIQT